MATSSCSFEERWSTELCGGRLYHFSWLGDRLVRVWTPPGWSKGKVAKALWLNDGQNLFRDEEAFGGASWGAAGTVAHLISCGAIPEILVLGIDHSGRMRTFDYLSAPPTGWDAPWGKGMRGDMWDAPGGGVDAYMEMLFSDVIPWAQHHFGLSEAPEDQVFGGSSFGGICALYMARSYPRAFAGFLVESPSFWAGNGRFMEDMKTWQSNKIYPDRMYLAMGEFEYTGFRGTDRPGSLECDKFLREACEECAGHLRPHIGSGLLSMVEPGGRHNERDWGRRFPCALRWLFGIPSSSPHAIWTRPSPLRPGPFELFVRRGVVKLPDSKRFQVHLGFNDWSSGVQTCDLLPSGIGLAEGDEPVLAALGSVPDGASGMKLVFTNGDAWDNNSGKDYCLDDAGKAAP
ncbi:ybbA [Symbiodinium sp. CCMP2592]|nr:ybbA [Symbiodinium sp. CCMP2592]